MDEKRRTRRWLRFSLRTLFVVVTIFGVWLGWQLNVIRNRKSFLQNVHYFGPANRRTADGLQPPTPQAEHRSRPHSDLPFYRAWLGDTSIERIDAWKLADAEEADRLFPELLELFFVDTDNVIKVFDGDRTVPRQPRRPD